MLQALLLVLTLTQQTPPQGKTVEERLKELEERLASLEKKRKDFSDQNAAIEKTLADLKSAREQMARQTAAAWVQMYAKAAQFSEQQSADLEKLWLVWTKDDFEKRADAAAWKNREEAIRKVLSPEQIPLLARRVREGQEANVRQLVTFLTRIAKLDAEKRGAFEKAVLAKIDFEEGPLLPQAHPEMTDPSSKIPDAVEAVLSQLSSTLTDSEAKAIRQTAQQWWPRPQR